MKRRLRAAWRLTEAAVLPALLRQLKGKDLVESDDPARIADLLDILRGDPDFRPLLKALLDPDENARRARFSALWPTIQARLTPRGRHHLALLHTRWGWEALEGGAGPAAAGREWRKASRHWSHVLADEVFLTDLASASGASPKATALGVEAVGWILKTHGDALMAGIDETGVHNPEALKPHWQVLVEAPDLMLLDETPDAVRRQLEASSSILRRQLIDKGMDVAQEQAQPIESTKATDGQLAQPFLTLQALVQVCGMQEDLSIWALDQAVQWSWPLYKTKEEVRLKRLLEASRPFADHVESLIRRNAGAFGRNSVCADYLLFVADFQDTEGQPATFRRALEVCPGHRNSRLMLSFHKLNLARIELAKAENPTPLGELGLVSDRASIDAARKAKGFIDEAEEIFPLNEKIADYRARQIAAFERHGLKIDGDGEAG